MNYYNEIDPYAAQWLRNLIAAGYIAPGVVDERSIEDITPNEISGYTQCHFFAGIGVWSYALRLAGWPDDRRVWTGSCPCQPFSRAGAGAGLEDERHLWPAWFHLIQQCGPDIVFGEQVEAAIAHGWLDLVQDDLEGQGYSFAPISLPAAGIGAPHIRQRLWFVADAAGERCDKRRSAEGAAIQRQRAERTTTPTKSKHTGKLSGRPERLGGTSGLADADGRYASAERQQRSGQQRQQSQDGGATEYMGNTDNARLEGRQLPGERAGKLTTGPTGLANHWSNAEWIFCRDGKYRPIEPGTFPLAHGITNRVGRLRAYGNAINPYVAAEVIAAYLETQGHPQ